MNEIHKRDAQVEILYINKELHEFRDIRNGDALYEYVSDKETAAREFGNLKKINDNYPKYVVSSRDETTGKPDRRGIRQMNLREFLLANFGNQ